MWSARAVPSVIPEKECVRDQTVRVLDVCSFPFLLFTLSNTTQLLTGPLSVFLTVPCPYLSPPPSLLSMFVCVLKVLPVSVTVTISVSVRDCVTLLFGGKRNREGIDECERMKSGTIEDVLLFVIADKTRAKGNT